MQNNNNSFGLSQMFCNIYLVDSLRMMPRALIRVVVANWYG